MFEKLMFKLGYMKTSKARDIHVAYVKIVGEWVESDFGGTINQNYITAAKKWFDAVSRDVVTLDCKYGVVCAREEDTK